jgi:hypothetical protein
MRHFIEQHRQEIDQWIVRQCSNLGSLSDRDRREWIANDERLYLWAKREGVKGI